MHRNGMRAWLSVAATALVVPLYVVACSVALTAPGTPAAQEPERWHLVEELRVGAVDDPDYALTAVSDVRPGPAGQVFVVQNQANQVLVFDSSGVRSHVIGRRGAGPGEFLGNIALTWLAGDTLGTFDLDQQRYSLFLPDGTHVRTGRILPRGSIGTVVMESLMEDGTALGYPRSALRSGVKHLLRYATDGVLLDTLAVVEIGRFMAEAILDNGSPVRFAKPTEFVHRDLMALDPSGAAVVVVAQPRASSGTQHPFRVTRVRITGDTVFDHTYSYTPRRIESGTSSGVVAELREGLLELSKKMPALGGGRAFNNDELDRMIEAVDVPEFHAPVSAVLVGTDGTTWLRREVVHPERVGWVVLDGRGERVALVDAPVGLKVHSANRRRLWGVIHDALDVPYLVRYRIERRE